MTARIDTSLSGKSTLELLNLSRAQGKSILSLIQELSASSIHHHALQAKITEKLKTAKGPERQTLLRARTLARAQHDTKVAELRSTQRLKQAVLDRIDSTISERSSSASPKASSRSPSPERPRSPNTFGRLFKR